MIEKKAGYLFEVSWEVCNKVGGIYTVVRSKAHQMVEQYKDNYFLIGPYFPKAMGEFQPSMPSKKIQAVIEKLKNENIIIYYGIWSIKGSPNILLVDFSKFYENTNKIKKQMWEDFKIDSLNAPSDYDEPVVWSWAVGRLLEELSKILDAKAVAHFHEWLAGAAALYLKKKKVKIGTVFTTHATVLGRTLSGNNIDIYKIENNKLYLELIDPDKEAYKFNVAAKHMLEKATAQNVDVFTTVSEITALESEHILKRKPDMLVPEGLDFSELPNMEEMGSKHRLYRSKIRQFSMVYFFPYYQFDIENTLFYFISGRYEFKNKGIDVTIRALSILNQQLIKENSKKTIIVFFFIPGNIRILRWSILQSRTLFESIEDQVEDNLKEMGEKVLYSIMQQKSPMISKIFDADLLQEIKKDVFKFKKDGEPPLATHELYDEQDDAILKAFREFNLLNKKTDKVKVILYPCYISSSDGLIGLDYPSVVCGSHLGIFPSSYEPWGYTPLECAAYGVPAITTDLAGFGKFVLSSAKDETGIFVIRRAGKAEEDIVRQLSDVLYNYSTTSKDERIKTKNKAMRFAAMCNWEKLIVEYVKAHNIAIDKVFI